MASRFRSYCPKCSRGPFAVNKNGSIRKHACWTVVSESEKIRASEQAERNADGKATCRALVSARARANRIDALKIAFAIGSLLMIVLGSCN